MTKKPQGAAIVSNSSRKLIGIITDGDLRRGFAINGNTVWSHSAWIYLTVSEGGFKYVTWHGDYFLTSRMEFGFVTEDDNLGVLLHLFVDP